MRYKSNENEHNTEELIIRYEKMMNGTSHFFFDSHEFEEIADHYIDKGLLGEAMSSMDIAFKQYPFSANFLIKKAQILTLLERLEEAGNALEIAETLEPSNADLFIAKGSILSKERKHQRALKYFHKAKKLSEEPLDCYPFIAFEYQCLGMFQEAIKYLSNFLKEEPKDDISLFNIAYCFDRAECYSEAIDFFTLQTNRAPYCELTWYHLGLFYNKTNQHDKAISAIDFALLIDDCFTAGYHEKARSLTHLHKYEEAIQTYLLTFAFEEATGYTYLKIGLAYKELKQYKQAIRYLTKACHEDPQLSEAWLEIGLCFNASSNHQEALVNINKALALNPEDTEYIHIQARTHYKLGLLAEADFGYQKLIELNYIDVSVWMEYAELLYKLGERNEAIHTLKQGLIHHVNHTELLLNLSAFLYLDNQLPLSSKYMKKTKDLNSNIIELVSKHLPYLKNDIIFQQLIKQC